MDSFHQILPDGGPVYYETPDSIGDFFMVEPWNAISSLAYLIPVIYWFYKLRNNKKEYLFLLSCLPLMFFGGLGSTLFHGFRSSPFLLYLDFAPILILLAVITYYFLYQLLNNHYIVSGFMLLIFAARFSINAYFPTHTGTNLSYFIGGAAVFIPALLLLKRTNYLGITAILFAVLFFSLALFFREFDRWPEQPFAMGTHFLWHIFSAFGGFFLGKYLFQFKFFKMRFKNTVVSA